MEHLRHFQLSDDPFRNEPLPGSFHASAAHRDALRRLDRGVRQARGLCLLVGEVGAGKTMLIRQLLERLEVELFEVVMMLALDPGPEAHHWLLRRLAGQLGIETPAPERDGLLAQIYDQLAIVREEGRHALLALDDAEALATPMARSDLGALLKLEYEDRRLLSVVLVGDGSLETTLARDPLLTHRVDVKVRLAPLDLEQAAGYLAHRIRLAQGDPALLAGEAVEALHRCGRGLPGPINRLADNALFEAFLCGRRQVLAADVERARRDLEWPADPTAELAGPASPPLLSELDSEVEAVFGSATAPRVAPSRRAPDRAQPRLARELPEEGPPKLDEPEVEDLLVELLDD